VSSRGVAAVDFVICLGPDSNRHGVSPKGFSYHYSFHCCMFPSGKPCICGLDFTFAIPPPFALQAD